MYGYCEPTIFKVLERQVWLKCGVAVLWLNGKLRMLRPVSWRASSSHLFRVQLSSSLVLSLRPLTSSTSVVCGADATRV
jgi:hypothetical protein